MNERNPTISKLFLSELSGLFLLTTEYKLSITAFKCCLVKINQVTLKRRQKLKFSPEKHLIRLDEM